MKRFYHQDSMKLVNLRKEDYEIQVYELDIPATYGFKYYKRLDEMFEEFFSCIGPTKFPTLFQIVGDFSALENADPEEKIYFTQAVVNIFVSHMVLEEKLPREQRLAPPKSLDELDLSVMNKKAVINKKIMYPHFSLEVLDKSGNVVYEVM
jgi:hypothetical protein